MKNKAKLVLVLGGLLALSWAFASCSQSTSDPSADAVTGTWTASETSSGITATSSIHFDGSGSFTQNVYLNGILMGSVNGTYTLSDTTITLTANDETMTGTITSSTTMEIDNTIYTKQ